jgi:HNH endonuclease
MRKSIQTSYKDIVNYWARHEDECGLAIDWADAHERCWRCSYKSRLERCHIIPHSLGGSEDPENLVLLCGRCHREAPNVADPSFMWIWLRAACVPFYDTYWTIRGTFEFEQMFGRRPFTELNLSKEQLKIAESLLREEMQNTAIHFGEGRMNPSTMACVLAKVEERLTGERPKLRATEWGQEYALKALGIQISTSEELHDDV